MDLHRSDTSSSDCSSERIAPYAQNRDSTPPLPASSSSKTLLLDEATKSRLLQLYTSHHLITDAKEIQSHFTVLYLTHANVHEVLTSQASNLQYSTHHHMLKDLHRLLQQSWRVTLGTLDYLELVWTGHRPQQNWNNALTSCTGIHDSDRSSSGQGPCPLEADSDEYLALNMAVTYYYNSEGEPIMSLAAIAMTKDAFNAIVQQIEFYDDSHPLNINADHIFAASPDSKIDVSFDTIPLVNRSLLIPTLCRWRNADVSSILSAAAESRAWSSKNLDVYTNADMTGVDLNFHGGSGSGTHGAWFFPTLKLPRRSESGYSLLDTDTDSDITTGNTTIDPAVNTCQFYKYASGLEQQASLDRHQTQTEQLRRILHPYVYTSLPESELTVSPHSSPVSTTSTTSTSSTTSPYELRCALIPGRDAVFRTIASRISTHIDRHWIRRSKQFDRPRAGATNHFEVPPRPDHGGLRVDTTVGAGRERKRLRTSKSGRR